MVSQNTQQVIVSGSKVEKLSIIQYCIVLNPYLRQTKLFLNQIGVLVSTSTSRFDTFPSHIFVTVDQMSGDEVQTIGNIFRFEFDEMKTSSFR